MLVGGGFQTPDARADEHADLVAVGLVQVQAGIQQRLPGGVDPELGEAIGSTRVLGGRESRCRIELFNFSGDAGIKGRRIEVRDPVDAALAGQEIFPHGLHVVAQRGDGPQSGQDDSSLGNIAGHKIKRGSLG